MNKLQYVKDNLILNLNTNLIPFWDKMLDDEFGGFYGKWNGSPIKDSDKGAVYLSRLLWSFSVLYKKTANIKFLSHANYLFKFMSTKLYDYTNKGFYWSCDYKGNVKNDHKHLYAQSFCLYGLSEYYDISRSRLCLDIIDDITTIIRKNFINFPNDYCEEYDKYWHKTPNKLLFGYEMIPEITTNTILHLIESLGTCYRIIKNTEHQDLCLKLIGILFKYGYDYERNSLIQFLDYNLKSKIDVISYGHDIEVSWLLNDVLDELDVNDNKIKSYREILSKLCNAALDGLYKDYLLSEKINGCIRSKDIIWWVQAETMIALLMLYKKTNEEHYLDKLYKVFNVVKDSLLTDNEWLWSADEFYNIKDEHCQAEMWKANYHNFRCIIKFMEV